MTSGFEKDLGGGLVLRSVRDERDIERFSAYQFDMFHNTECVTVDRLLRYHPEVTLEDFFFVEDTSNGRIASTTCFVPWHCRYDEVELKVAQLEVVATHPDYRRRGLVREQIRHFHDLADQRGYEMTAIGGIPYYYRQFGYAYAVDSGGNWLVPPYAIPAAPAGPQYRLRPATEADSQALTAFYEAAMAPVQFYDKRPLFFWQYLMRWAMWPATIVEDEAGRPVGYVSATPMAGGAAVYVRECGIIDHDVALAAMRLLSDGGDAGRPRDVVVSSPAESALARIAAGVGSYRPDGYQWLVRVCDLARLFRSIAPVLERRLRGSLYAGLSGTYRFSNFHQAIDVRFAAGRVADVQPLGFVPSSNDDSGGDFVLPPDAFARLVLGYRTLAQLRDPWPDMVIRPGLEPLLATLFPPMTSFLYLPYSYRGPVPDTAEGALTSPPRPSPKGRGEPEPPLPSGEGVGGGVGSPLLRGEGRGGGVLPASIRDSLRALGVAPGDSLIMHCALSSVGHVDGGADGLIDGVLAAVGPTGTVMMPVLPDIYVPFDVKTSPSTVGHVSEVFWRRPDAVRSRHPSHSVAAIGARAAALTEGHEHTLPTGLDSPFERLCRVHGWVLLVGVDQDRNTMLHFAETLVHAPYLRTGNLQVVGDDGAVSEVVVPAMAYGHREFIGIDALLCQRGIVRLGRIGDAVVRLMRADALVDATVALLNRDPAALLCTKPRCVFCAWARAQIEATRTGRPDTTDWAAVTRAWGCGDPHCECCAV